MVKHVKAKIDFLKRIKPDIYLLSFNSSYIARKANAGQFVHIKVDEKVTILRRPFSIHKIDRDKIYILFKVRGRGTKLLSQYKKGHILDIIGPLGNGFSFMPQTAHRRPLINILVAGGMGMAPLVFLAKKLTEIRNPKSEIRNLVLLGTKNKREILAEQEFRRLGFDVRITTDDGSRGFKGSVVDLLAKELSAKRYPLNVNLYACGPKEMFSELAKVIKKYPKINCQVSFEQFMGCGLGVCCGCTIETKNGYKKVCKDGPVFNLKEI
jgi:dihydroorotate dehydrogenase electron transfer subunit